MAHIVIIDSDETARGSISSILKGNGYHVDAFAALPKSISFLGAQSPDLTLLGAPYGEPEGMALIGSLRSLRPDLSVLVMVPEGNIGAAIEAMDAGARGFLCRPTNRAELIASVALVLANSGDALCYAPAMVGRSAAFQESVNLVLKFARFDISMLLLGETGTGKEVFARVAHACSARRDRPFVAVDCSILAESLVESELFGHERGTFTGAISTRVGRLELAQGGTLFLDEIGNLSLSMQAKLLRTLQERCIERVGGRKTIHLDVRLLAATNADIERAIQTGQFRQDLYYRLQEVTIRVPSLAERRDDIVRLAQYFSAISAHRFGLHVSKFSPEARARITNYPWPGNIRELSNAMKSAVALADDIILVEHLPLAVRAGRRNDAQTPHKPAMGATEDDDRLHIDIDLSLSASELDLKAVGAQAAEQAERLLLRQLLQRRAYSGAQLAKMLNVDPKTLRIKLRRYGLSTTHR